MTIIFPDTPGWLYLLHFTDQLGNLDNPRACAQHYVGWALDPARRLQEHADGHGAAITRAARARGLAWLAFIWPAPLAVEKLVKRRKEAHVFCPVCSAWAGREPRPIPQLLPPLPAGWDFDQVELPTYQMDWYELRELVRVRAARGPRRARLIADGSDGVDGDLPF